MSWYTPKAIALVIGLTVGLPAAAQTVSPPAQAQPAKAGAKLDLAQMVVKLPLAKGVSLDDAAQSMKIRANNLNMKLVGEMPLSKQLQAMGEKSRRIEIFQFCDPLTAKKMVEANIDFAAYLPCRISLVEDAQGKGWLVMMNLDPLINANQLSPELKKEAIKVRDTLNEIMRAGAKGDW